MSNLENSVIDLAELKERGFELCGEKADYDTMQSLTLLAIAAMYYHNTDKFVELMNVVIENAEVCYDVSIEDLKVTSDLMINMYEEVFNKLLSEE